MDVVLYIIVCLLPLADVEAAEVEPTVRNFAYWKIWHWEECSRNTIFRKKAKICLLLTYQKETVQFNGETLAVVDSLV